MVPSPAAWSGHRTGPGARPGNSPRSRLTTDADRPASHTVTLGTNLTGTDQGDGELLIDATGGATSDRVLQLKIIDDTTILTTGDGKLIFAVDDTLNGLNLVDADAFVTTVSSSGLPTVQIRNITQTADMLTTRITIDAQRVHQLHRRRRSLSSTPATTTSPPAT